MSQPTPLKFMEALNGLQKAAVARTAVELDVFSHIARGHRTVEALAARTACAEKGIRVLLDALTILDLIEKDDGHYRLTADSAVYLDRASPHYLGDSIVFMHSDFVRDAFLRFTDAVRLGGTAVDGQGTVEAGHPVWEQYARGMIAVAMPQARKVAELAAGARRILDLAAGHGLFGILLLQGNPEATCVAVDFANVLPLAEENARAAGVAGRFETRAGSAFDIDLGSGYDTVLVPNLLHHFDRAGCLAALRRVYGALAPGGRAFVVAPMPNDDRVSPSASAWFATMMLATTPAGDAYTSGENAAMLRETGFAEPELHFAPGSSRSVMVARKPF